MKSNRSLIIIPFLALLVAGCSPSKPKKKSSTSPVPVTSESSATSGNSKTSATSSAEQSQTSTSSTATSTTSVVPTSSSSSSVTPIPPVTSSSSITPIPPGSSSSIPQPISDYYSSITDGMTGTALLDALNSLNKKKFDVDGEKFPNYGYKGFFNQKYYKYTEYDPTNVKYNSDGQPYSDTWVTFYSSSKYDASGTISTTVINREHVWPNSKGGGSVEDDILMPRPTLCKENGSRGNSFYVEGMKHSSNGWDPAMEDFGIESYRGDSARIVFYCAIANKNLKIIDQATDSDGNKTMGKLSDLLKWNLKYSVDAREHRRNEGAQYLQGNRNPFVDHPEYACRIWGGTNSTTKSICGM